MNRICHQSTGVTDLKRGKDQDILTHKEFILFFKQRLEKIFDTEVEDLDSYAEKTVVNCYSFSFGGSYIMVHYEELTDQSSLLHYEIHYGCMHSNLMLAVKWMEAHLQDGVLKVSRPEPNDRVLGDLFLTGTQLCHHTERRGLEAYLEYIKECLNQLRFSLDGWFPHSMPGFYKGMMLTVLPGMGWDFITKMFYLRDYLEDQVKEIPSENHEFDDFIYYTFLSWKDWGKAMEYIEKEVPDHVQGVKRVLRANRNVCRRIRCLLGLGRVNEAEACLDELEDCRDDYQYTWNAQDLKMRILYAGEKFDDLLQFANGPEVVESPRIAFWKSMTAIKMNEVDEAMSQCLAYEKECGFDLLLRHKISHRFHTEFKVCTEYSKYLSNIELTDDHHGEMTGQE